MCGLLCYTFSNIFQLCCTLIHRHNGRVKKSVHLGVRVSEEFAEKANDALQRTNSETVSRFFRSCLDDLITAHAAGERIVEPVRLARQPRRRNRK